MEHRGDPGTSAVYPEHDQVVPLGFKARKVSNVALFAV